MARLMCQLSSPIDTLEAIFDFYLRDFKLSEAYTPINQHNTYNPLYYKKILRIIGGYMSNLIFVFRFI